MRKEFDPMLVKAIEKAREIGLQIEPIVLTALELSEAVKGIASKKATFEQALEYQFVLSLLASNFLAHALSLKNKNDPSAKDALLTQKELMNLIEDATRIRLEEHQQIFNARG